MSIFRESFQKDIKTSLENRQVAMTRRSTGDIQYLNSRNSWIRMCSSVNVGGSNSLAEQYVLQGGTLTSGGNLKSGIGKTFDNAYSINTPGGGNNRLGIRPMPGITSIEVKSKSAYGSLREATVSFQCWDVAQLSDLELLYMRPGYTVLLEWGWTPYLNVNGGYESTFNDFYSSNILNATVIDRTKIFQDLYDKCTKYGGNYDAIFGYVKNYQWSAREDGGYDCQTTIISTGEVIESIKVNYVRGDLKDLKMYDAGSTGGFLDDLFTGLGAVKRTQLVEHYQKNVLAGIWAELYYRLQDTSISTKGSILDNTKYKTLTYPGLENYGNLDTIIQPSNKNKTYITLEAAFDIINKYVLTKSGKDNKPLVQLTTQTEGYSGNGVTDLLCVAHPVQISIDPTICIIRNDLWSDTIAPSITGATAGVATSIDQQANDIISRIDQASTPPKASNTASPPDQGLTGLVESNNSTHNASFLAAIRAINSPALFERIQQAIAANAYPIGGGAIGSGRGYTGGPEQLGLAGWIGDPTTGEFRAGGGDLSEYTVGVNKIVVDEELTSIWYVYLIGQHIKSLGYNVAINLTNTAGSLVTLESILTAAGNPALQNRVELANIHAPGSIRIGTYDASTFRITSNFKFTSISFSGGPSGAAAAAVALVLQAKDAATILTSLNTLDQQFFLNGDSKTELGVIGNIYVSLDFLYRQSLNTNLEASDTKEKNEINLYSYIKGVMSGIQSTIGNVNNFEVHVDPVDNKARVIDVNYTHDKTVSLNNLFKLEVHNLNSIVRKYTLQSQIFPNQSSIIAIGSQKQGGQGGIQNKTVTQFNNNLVDRIVGDKVDPEKNTYDASSLATGLAGIIILYAALGISIPPGLANNINLSEYISRARNALRDLIVYFQNLYDSPGANRNILPYKFSFEMDGVGGLVIGSLFTINDDIIPKGYQGNTAGKKLAQTITSISHTISNDWTTKIDALNIILERPNSNFDSTTIPALIKEGVQAILSTAGTVAGTAPPGGGGPGGSFFGASGGKDCGNVPTYNLVANNAGTLTQSQIVNQLKTTYSTNLKALARALIVGTQEQGLMTKSSGTVIVGGNFNYFGVQGDILPKWSDPSGYIIGCHEAREKSSGCRRYFASFSSLDNAGAFMIQQVSQSKRGLLAATTAEAITEAYINNWWSPGNKADILAKKTDPSGKYQEKLKITKDAIAALATYGISI
jgi:hypothetical protein